MREQKENAQNIRGILTAKKFKEYRFKNAILQEAWIKRFKYNIVI